MIKAADADKNGRIDFMEFQKICDDGQNQTLFMNMMDKLQ